MLAGTSFSFPLLLVILFSLNGNTTGRWSTSPEVDLGYARYQGVINPETRNTEFLGIRYAEPPTGHLRWRKPRPPRHEHGVQLANAQPKMCFQAMVGSNNINPMRNVPRRNNTLASDSGDSTPSYHDQSEDCLFLNVYIPGTTKPRRRLPVVVWIHGGGYLLGSASRTGLESLGLLGPYNGNDLLAQAGGNVIVVSVQYRLGIFGFLAGWRVKISGELNAGLLDQQRALEWVQTHIHKFGGDASMVTIWGESAGAGSAIQHLIANGGNTQPPLFKAAMLSSTYLPPQYPYFHRIPEAMYSRVVKLTGCSTAIGSLECLRELDAHTLQKANVQINDESLYLTTATVPVVDGTFIQESPSRAIRSGRVNTKRYILAIRNADEGGLSIHPGLLTSLQDYIRELLPTIRDGQATRIAALYGATGLSQLEQAALAHGEAIFVCPTYLLSSTLDNRVYQGLFAIPPGLHITDIPYYFPSTISGSPPFNNTQFIDTFAQVFMDFAISHDPNELHDPKSILPPWSKWSRHSQEEMVFNRTGSLPDIRAARSSDALRERCRFWAGLSSSTYQ